MTILKCTYNGFIILFQMRIAMNSVGAIKSIDQDEKQLQDTIRYVFTNKQICFSLLFVWNCMFIQSAFISNFLLKVKL